MDSEELLLDMVKEVRNDVKVIRDLQAKTATDLAVYKDRQDRRAKYFAGGGVVLSGIISGVGTWVMIHVLRSRF